MQRAIIDRQWICGACGHPTCFVREGEKLYIYHKWEDKVSDMCPHEGCFCMRGERVL